MVRTNGVTGPTSALTEFLRESGITATTVARRVRTQQQQPPAPAGPSNPANEQINRPPRPDGYNSDHLDDSEDDKRPATKKRKLTKAAQAKLKAKKKKDEDGVDDEDEEEDTYTALAKSMYNSTKPPAGSFETCAKCEKQFTVTKYTIAAHPPPGWLCHTCAKSSGSDPFKKPAAPRKRKVPGDKRKVISFQEKIVPSLVTLCVQVVTRYIDDIEALGDIGSMNVDEIIRALSRNRSLTAENAPLFYNVENKRLTLYDVTRLMPPALCALASLNPNLTSLRLDLCGCMDDSVLTSWCKSMPHLTRLELWGPFLVRPPAWKAFFKSHPELESFLIIQSPRFDLDCMNALASNSPNLKELRLKEIGKMSDDFLQIIGKMSGLTYLDLSYPGKPDEMSEIALITLLESIGSTLTHLDLSGNKNITDTFLIDGIKPYAGVLESLVLSNLVELTDEGVVEFFNSWDSTSGLKALDLSRNHELGSASLDALLKHSGSTLVALNINSWRGVSAESVGAIGDVAEHVVRVDVGFCREVDDFVVKSLVDGCLRLREIMCWGCNKVSVGVHRKKGVSIIGIEPQA